MQNRALRVSRPLFPPEIFTYEQNVCPSERRDVRQEFRRAFQPGLLPFGDSDPQVFGVPEDHDSGEQVQSGDTEVLAFGGAVADFTLTADAQGTFQSMVCLAFVQADVCPPRHGCAGPIAAFGFGGGGRNEHALSYKGHANQREARPLARGQK